MAKNVAKLAGVPLEMDQLVEWRLTGGVAPAVLQVEVAAEQANQLMEQAGEPVSLEIESSADGTRIQADQLYILEQAPGGHPDRIRVIVADRRFWFRHTWVSRVYNARRSTGDLTLLGDALESASLRDVEAYAAYSLNEEEDKWTARGMIEDVLHALVGSDFEFRMDIPDVSVEDLLVEGSGDAALRTVLDYVPGAEVFIDLSGKLIVFDSRSGDEGEVLSGRKIHWPGLGSADWPLKADRAGLRASAVRVLFDARMEVEVRCVANNIGIGSAANGLFARNVLPLPDRSLSVRYAAGEDPKSRGQQSWVPFGDHNTFGALRAWAEDGANPILPGQETLRQSLIRKHYMSGFAFLRPKFINGLGATNSIWAARMQAVNTEWRATFQLDKYWWGRIRSFQPFRLAIINPEFGRTQSPSPVFQDYCMKPSYLGIVKAGRLGGRLQHGSLVDVDLDNDPAVSPFFVVPRDREAGVFSFRPAADSFGEYASLAPGLPVGGRLPVLKPGLWNQNPAGAEATWQHIELQESHEARTILTITPGSPNDERRLFAFEVAPESLTNDLGREVGPAWAPPVDIRVMPNLITADFGWRAEADNGAGWGGIADVLGATRAAIRDLNLVRQGRGELGGTNEDLYGRIRGDLLNEVQISDVAHAVAAAYYDGLLDRPETGGAEQELDPEAEPAGGMVTVAHRLYQDGRTTTSLAAPKVVKAASFWRFLPESTRRIVLRSLEG